MYLSEKRYKFLENNNNETRKMQKSAPKNSNEKYYRNIILALAAVVFICLVFSGIQSVYIFRLNSGREGIFSYMRIARNNESTASTAETEETPAETEVYPEPWFSLEEAANIASADKTRKSTVDIVKEVSPATVSLSVIGVDDGKETKLGSGTGFIITDDGYIVTNQHVVVLADETVSTYYVTVILPDENEPVRAEIVGSDVQTDIAVLKVDTDRKLPCVVLGDSDTLQAGELAIVIGNALGTLDDTVTVGVISAPSREINRKGYRVEVIQTDASINPGNSGGPLINSFGEVVGITNSKIVTTNTENLGFAIPINSVKTIIESIINYGKVINRPYLGVSVRFVSDDSYYGAVKGIYVEEIVKDGPADQAGFMLGDRIISMDGVEIKETGDIIKVRDSHEVGDTIETVVERDGKEITLSLKIADSADFPV